MFDNISGDKLKDAFKENKNVRFATIAVGGVVVLALGYFAYKAFIFNPAEQKSMEGGYVGLNYAAMDSTDLAIEELAPFVKKYDGKKGGEVAQFTLARQYMAKGEFAKALENLSDVDVEDTYVQIHAIGLQGDCYSEMKKWNDAVDMYIKASEMDINDYTTPMYLFKAALLTELKLEDPAAATVMYQEIKDNYLAFANQKTIERYVERAKNKKVK
ncbi:MAG: tetratricopeptide repeat protein [Bacteroidetes bacterium]|nr:tetratricopeptide repeat protein [Bacteroidota bacterium]